MADISARRDCASTKQNHGTKNQSHFSLKSRKNSFHTQFSLFHNLRRLQIILVILFLQVEKRMSKLCCSLKQ